MGIFLNLFQNLTSRQVKFSVDYLLGARFYAGMMLKQVPYDKITNDYSRQITRLRIRIL